MGIEAIDRVSKARRPSSIHWALWLPLMIVLSAPAFSPIGESGGSVSMASSPSSEKKDSDSTDTFIREEVKKYLGVSYRWGGSTRKGMDCSGFVRRIYKDLFGVELPHNARAQYPLPILRDVPLEELRTGDLIFFSPSTAKKRINHVGIYLSDGRFIHAARKKGVIITSLSNRHWNSRIYAGKKLASQDNGYHEEVERFPGSLSLSSDRDNLITLQWGTDQFILSPSIIGHDPFAHELKGLSFTPRLIYTRALIDQSWNFHLEGFQEFSSFYGVETKQKKPPDLDERNLSYSYMDQFYRAGLKVASNLRLSKYLSITPSLTYFHNEEAMDGICLPRVSYGVDLGIGSTFDRWGLSMALYYSEVESFPSPSTLTGNERNALEMSLTYRQRINPNLQLLLTGEYAERYAPGAEKSPTEEKKEDQGVFIMLNFTY